MRTEVVITGGAGFIGSHLADALVREGYKVSVLDNLSRGRLANLPSEARFQWIDLASGYPDLSGYDIVIHAAARVAGIQYNRAHHMEMLMDNLMINMQVTQAVREAGPSRYIYISTACVYPHDAPVPTPEGAAEICNPEPTNWGYGVAKWVGEQQAKLLYRQYGIPTLILRFFNAFGPRDYYDEETSHVAPALIRRILEGQDPIVIWGSGNQSRSLVDARDIARAVVRLLKTDEAFNGVPVNIGHDREITIRQLAQTICDLAGKHPRLVFDTSQPEGYPRRAADVTRLRHLIGWVPDTPLEITLSDMIAEYRGGRANY